MFSELSDSESDIDIPNFIRSSDQNLSPICSDKQSALTGGGRDRQAEDLAAIKCIWSTVGQY